MQFYSFIAGFLVGGLAILTSFDALNAASAIRTAKVQAGYLKDIPQNTCGYGDFYVARDMPLGQQLYICGGGHVWFQQGTLGSNGPGGGTTGALKLTKGSLDVNTAIVPLKFTDNTFAGKTNVNAFRFIPNKVDHTDANAIANGCIDRDEDIGNVRFDSGADPLNTQYDICLLVNGVPRWVVK